MNAHSHPMWAILRLTIMMGTLTFILWLTAHRFDDNEISQILWMFLGAAGIEGGIQAAQRLGGLARPRPMHDDDGEPMTESSLIRHIRRMRGDKE